MWLVFLRQRRTQQVQFIVVGLFRQLAADELEAQVYQPGVEHVGLAVVADALDVAGQPGVPDLVAAHAHLAGEAQHGGDLVQRRVGAHLVAGQHVHEIGVALVVAAQVVVPLEVAVVGARVPVARRLDAVQQGAVVQHRQVEAAAVPGHQGGREAVDAIEEALHQLGLVGVRLAQRPDLDPVAVAQHHRDGADALQVQAQEIGTTGLLRTQVEHGLGDIFVTEVVEAVQAPPRRHVGDGLDIEDENVLHHSAGNTPVDR